MSAAKGVGIAVASIVAIFALSIGIWAFRVSTSDVKGQGDATIAKNSAANWTKAQGEFESLYAEIVATDRKVTVAKAALDLDSDDQTSRDIYLGTQNVCLSFVADYNAKARTYLSANFRSADLPAQITDVDPTTDCKG